MKEIRLCGCLAICAALCGCNIGMAPTGGSDAQIQANFEAESPQQQIQTIQGSPAPAAKKAELIKAIEDKYHITAPAAQAPFQPGRTK